MMAGEPASGWWVLLPRQLRELPADLAAVVALTLATLLAVLVPGVNQTPLRVILGLPFVLFLPGYAFIAALFPEGGEPVPADDEPDTEAGRDTADNGPAPGTGAGTAPDDRRSGIDGIERVALSFGLSIAIVPLIGLVLNFTPWGIRLGPILVSVSGFTLVATAVAARRRKELPAEERFSVPYREWLAAGKTELLEPEDRMDAALNVLLVVSVLLAVASVGYAVAVPKTGESFTEFYLLTEDDGELVADDYPTEFTLGEQRPIVVGVGNQEHRQQNYTWVAELQRVRIQNNSTTVLHDEELGRRQVTLAHNQTTHQEFAIRPTFTGTRLRVTFLLYKGSAPADPRIATAYRETHLWINVTSG